MEVKYDAVVRETAKALLLRFDEDEVWVPKSQVQNHYEDMCVIDLPLWLCEEKGIEDYAC